MSSQSTSLPAIPQLPPEPGQKMVPAAETTIPLQAPAKDEPDTSGPAGRSRRRAARHRVLVWLGLLDGGPLSGLDR